SLRDSGVRSPSTLPAMSSASHSLARFHTQILPPARPPQALISVQRSELRDTLQISPQSPAETRESRDMDFTA
ncbi:uncharacterized, partial [Tachysurus ichikawai]